MANELEIRQIKISAPRPGVPRILSFPGRRPAVPGIEAESSGEFIDLEISVKNTSDSDRYAISSLRKLKYSPSSKTLSVELNEPEKDTRIISPRLPPKMTVIPTGGTKVIHISVPTIIHEIQPSDTLGMSVKTIDISKLEHVHVTIASSDKEFTRDPSITSDLRIKSLREWGRMTKKKFDKQIPLKRKKNASEDKE